MSAVSFTLNAQARTDEGKGASRRLRRLEAKLPAVIYGAGPRTVLESNAKRADEHVRLEDLRRATQVIARTLLESALTAMPGVRVVMSEDIT